MISHKPAMISFWARPRRLAEGDGWVNCPRTADDEGKRGDLLLSTFNLYRTGGLAASPGSCRIITDRSQNLRKWESRNAWAHAKSLAQRRRATDSRNERPEGAQREGGRMGSYVLGFQEIDQTQVAVVGGKGAQLGELSRIEGIRVPAGFCGATDALRRVMAGVPP